LIIVVSLFLPLQDGKAKEGCKSFVTYQYFNPDGNKVDDNLKYYKSLKLDDSAFTPLETIPYKDLYIEGMELYSEKKWSEAIKKFEASLKSLYSELDECYILCEAFNNVDDLVGLEYYSLLSGLFMSSLKCRTECMDRLDFFRLNPVENILSSHYQFMQFTYYQCKLYLCLVCFV